MLPFTPCSEDLSAEEQKELAVLLGNKSFRKAAGKVLAVQEELNQLNRVDLSTAEGLSKAKQTQGMIQGISLVFSLLLTMTEEDSNGN